MGTIQRLIIPFSLPAIGVGGTLEARVSSHSAWTGGLPASPFSSLSPLSPDDWRVAAPISRFHLRLLSYLQMHLPVGSACRVVGSRDTQSCPWFQGWVCPVASECSAWKSERNPGPSEMVGMALHLVGSHWTEPHFLAKATLHSLHLRFS